MKRTIFIENYLKIYLNTDNNLFVGSSKNYVELILLKSVLELILLKSIIMQQKILIYSSYQKIWVFYTINYILMVQ